MSDPLPGSSVPTPLALLGVVTHVGSLDETQKGVQGESYEGMGLSFSVHPEDWEVIARLGGNPWWEVDLSDRKIVDGHQAIAQSSSALTQWAVENDLVTRCEEFVLSYEDSEMGGRVEMVLASHEEALDEAEFIEEGDIACRPGLAPTARLLEAMGHSVDRAGRPCSSALASVLTVWAQDQGFDGVWWEDDYSPDQLSAPRGVIFASRVPGLSFKCVRQPEFRARSPRP